MPRDRFIDVPENGSKYLTTPLGGINLTQAASQHYLIDDKSLPLDFYTENQLKISSNFLERPPDLLPKGINPNSFK